MRAAASASIGDMSAFPLEISESPDSIGAVNCTNQDKSPNIAGLQQSIKSVISRAAAAFKQIRVSIGPLETAIYGIHWTDAVGIWSGDTIARARGAVHWRCGR